MIEHSGIGTHIRGLLEAMADLSEAPQLTLLGDPAKLKRYPWLADWEIAPFDTPIYSMREQFGFPFSEASGCLLHTPHYNAPLLRRGSLVVTVHDLIHLLMPGKGPQAAMKRVYAGVFFRLLKRRADRILTVSEATRRDLIERLGLPEERIIVTPNALSAGFRPVQDAARLDAFRHQLKLPGAFLLAVGIDKPHKNMERLLRTLARLWREGWLDLPLYVAGVAKPAESRLPRLAEELGTGESVRFLPHLPYEELPMLYQSAHALIFPSLYEGFGLPVLEAQACGCPVAASNAASIPEAAGEGAVFFDPRDEAAMEASILQVVDDDALRERLRAAGRENLARFSWQSTARRTLEIYQELSR
ncbi:glycosyltransferase family 4 protein [Candidatus Sumerlaeota bacterium]|nr:glycosyltransferase family 4 protein [Candidatus Sumerlaeota bacterium]